MSAIATSVKLDPELKERVQNVAKGQRRTAHWVMREAISEYVSREEERQQFYRDGQEAWEDYQRTGLHLTHEEVDAWFAKLQAGEDVPPPECHT
jgi:predicted transcriptional regulator